MNSEAARREAVKGTWPASALPAVGGPGGRSRCVAGSSATRFGERDGGTPGSASAREYASPGATDRHPARPGGLESWKPGFLGAAGPPCAPGFQFVRFSAPRPRRSLDARCAGETQAARPGCSACGGHSLGHARRQHVDAERPPRDYTAPPSSCLSDRSVRRAFRPLHVRACTSAPATVVRPDPLEVPAWD